MEDSMEVLKGLHITSLDEEESEQSDVDDINDDDDDEVCIPATLGFVEKPEKPWALLRQIFPSKTGGTPAWLDPINLPSGRSFICDFCEEPLQFLLQVYAPISEKEYSFHRVLYVFTCMSMTCLLRDQHEQWEREPQKPLRSVKVWRCQLPRTNQFYSSNPPKYDGSDRPLGIGAPLCTWCGTWKGDKVCSSCKHARYCSEKHQAINWRSGHKLKCRQITASSSPCSMSSKEIQEVASMSLWPEFEIKIEDECESNVEIPQGQVVTGKSDLDESEGGDEDEISWATFLERIGRAPEQVISWATFQERVGRAPEQVISVLVHSGGVHGGHYYAYIRPTLSDQWIKFDDERVTKEDMKRALEEQYGGEEELPQTNPGFNNMPFKFTKYSNAYMLVYIRESDKEKILCNVDEKDIAEHLRERLKREQEEKEHKKKEKAEAHLYTIIKVARDEDLAEQIGKEIYFDLVDHEKVKCFRIQKQMPFNLFKEEVAKEFGIPAQFQRFWLWAKRQNHTYRPNKKKNPSLSSSCLQVKEEEKSNQRQRKNVIVTMTKTRDLTACFEDRHLPAELLSEILSRLPVKSLLRFRCVSKSWCSLVDDDGDFARLHLNTFKNNCDETRLSVFESGIDDRCVVRSSDIFEPISETPLPFLPGHDRLPWSILSSIDGLILLKYWGNCSRNCSSGRRIGGKFNLLKLWNPSIREFRDVPPPPVSGDGCPSLIDIEIGLGYDPLSKDYKHVKLIFASPTVLHSVAIYTVGAGSWKMIPFKGNGSSSSWPIWHRDPWVSFPTSNVYLEGSLYFFAKNSNDIKTWELVCFDMSKEVFSSITTPDDPYFRWGVTLVLIDGRSSVAVLNMYSDEKSVWVLERETMNWTKRWSFISENTRILYVKKNDDILTLRIREAISDEKTGDELRVTREEVVSYSLEKPEYKIWPLKRAIKSRWIKHVYGNVESLILHKRNMNV